MLEAELKVALFHLRRGDFAKAGSGFTAQAPGISEEMVREAREREGNEA